MNYAFRNGKNFGWNKRNENPTGALYSGRKRNHHRLIPDANADLHNYKVIDLHGQYILPGLINMHVHLAGNGKPQKKAAQ